MPTQSQNNPRVLTRGELTKFRASFFIDDAKTMPIIPIDPLLYPSYRIVDINGMTVQSGVGVQEALNGYWLTEFQVAKDAPLAYNKQRWRIEWSIVSNDNRQIEFTEEFDVRDVIVSANTNREIKTIALAGKPHLVTTRMTVQPFRLSLDVLQGNAQIITTKNYPNDIQFRVDGDSYVFYYTIPAGILSCNTGYSLLWSVQECASSTVDFEFQNVWSVSPFSFQAMSSLRMLIDRFQKRLGRVQAYEDSDLFEYLMQGLSVINGWYPTTTFISDQLPGPIHHFWILASAWYALNAQYLLETDMAFNFSGQTVTLDYDHTSALDTAMGRMMSHLNDHLTPAKMAVVRAGTPVGVFAGKPIRLNALHNFTYRLQSFNSGGVVDLLSKIGLL